VINSNKSIHSCVKIDQVRENPWTYEYAI